MRETKREEWLINSLPCFFYKQPLLGFIDPPEAFDSLLHPEQKPPYGSKLQRLVTQHKDNLCPLRALRFIQASPYEPSAGRYHQSIHPVSHQNNVLILHSSSQLSLCPFPTLSFGLIHRITSCPASQRASDMMRKTSNVTRAEEVTSGEPFEEDVVSSEAGFPGYRARVPQQPDPPAMETAVRWNISPSRLPPHALARCSSLYGQEPSTPWSTEKHSEVTINISKCHCIA